MRVQRAWRHLRLRQLSMLKAGLVICVLVLMVLVYRSHQGITMTNKPKLPVIVMEEHHEGQSLEC